MDGFLIMFINLEEIYIEEMFWVYSVSFNWSF